jgi:hypothetical protein
MVLAPVLVAACAIGDGFVAGNARTDVIGVGCFATIASDELPIAGPI